jgi:hypothetical protein
MSFIFIVVLRTRKHLTPNDVAAVKGLRLCCIDVQTCIVLTAFVTRAMMIGDTTHTRTRIPAHTASLLRASVKLSVTPSLTMQKFTLVELMLLLYPKVLYF